MQLIGDRYILMKLLLPMMDEVYRQPFLKKLSNNLKLLKKQLKCLNRKFYILVNTSHLEGFGPLKWCLY